MNFIVIGGAGALGKAIIRKIASETTAANTNIINIAYKPNAQATFDINMNLIPTAEISDHVFKKLAQMQINTADVIINVAGGWTDGDAKSDSLLIDSEKMWNQSVQSSMLALQLAAKLFDPSKQSTNLLVLTSAKVALSPTPSMLAYGAAKAAVIHLARSAASSISGRLCTLLPVILDTEANRQDMPNESRDTWTPCPVIGDEIWKWVASRGPLPSLIVVETDGTTGTTFKELNL